MFHNARREAFSHWLSSVSAETIQKELQENRYKVRICTLKSINFDLHITHSNEDRLLFFEKTNCNFELIIINYLKH